MNEVSFVEAIRLATENILSRDPTVHILGLGVSYPNGADGTLTGLAAKFPDSFHDVSCSEAAITGAALGMATSGLRPIVHHGRIEFALYAANQIITEAANWNYMFGGSYKCPMVIRVCIGRQWGNGPVHTRNVRGLFAVPGLKVVCPSSPEAAAGLLLSAVEDDSPVVYLEHRWLYKLKGRHTPGLHYALDKAEIIRNGTDVTIVAVGDAVLEALRARRLLAVRGISAQVIDLVSIYPMDIETVQAAVKYTGVLVAVDSATPAFSCASEIIGRVSVGMNIDTAMVTAKDTPCPTSPALSQDYYPKDTCIANAVMHILCAPGSQLTGEKTFEELNLPPTVNIDEL